MSLPQFPGDSREPDPGFHFPPIPDDYWRRLVRPPSVFAGCVMAWLGSSLGLVIGIVLITIGPGSPALQNVAAADRSDVAHTLGVLGVVLAVWCPIVIVVTYFAYKGDQRAALALVAMAGVYLLVALVSLAFGAGAQGGPGLIWTIVSAGLVYAPAASRAWFSAKSAERERMSTPAP
jgi:hypothetical protein